MSSCLRRRHADPIKSGTKRARDVHPGSLGIGRGPPRPATQPAGPPQLGQQPFAFGLRLGGPFLITCGVRRIEIGAKLAEALLVGSYGGRVEYRAGAGGLQATPARSEVAGGDVMARGS